MARSFSGGVALCYVLPVLWMTSRLAVMGRMSLQGLSVAKYSAPPGVARPGRSLMSMNALFLDCNTVNRRCICLSSSYQYQYIHYDRRGELPKLTEVAKMPKNVQGHRVIKFSTNRTRIRLPVSG